MKMETIKGLLFRSCSGFMPGPNVDLIVPSKESADALEYPGSIQDKSSSATLATKTEFCLLSGEPIDIQFLPLAKLTKEALAARIAHNMLEGSLDDDELDKLEYKELFYSPNQFSFGMHSKEGLFIGPHLVKGRITYHNGNYKDGIFDPGDVLRKGTHKTPEYTYTGEFNKRGKKEGLGCCQDKYGHSYEGQWFNGDIPIDIMYLRVFRNDYYIPVPPPNVKGKEVLVKLLQLSLSNPSHIDGLSVHEQRKVESTCDVLKNVYNANNFATQHVKSHLKDFMRNNRDTPVLIEAGSKGHLVGIVVFKGHLILCNGGFGLEEARGDTNNDSFLQEQELFTKRGSKKQFAFTHLQVNGDFCDIDNLDEVLDRIGQSKLEDNDIGIKRLYSIRNIPGIVQVKDTALAQLLKVPQRGGSCWYRSMKLALLASLILQYGTADGQCIYDKTLSSKVATSSVKRLCEKVT